MSMHNDYTINDAHKDGFECGVLYVLRYFHEVEKRRLTDRQIAKLAEHLESHRFDKDFGEWTELIYRNRARWK